MQTEKKSQISPYFLNTQHHYADLYVAKFFFDQEIRLIMSVLPWGLTVKERDILRVARKYRIRAPHVRKIIEFLSSLDIVKRDIIYEWHVEASFEHLYCRSHALPQKYTSRFFNYVTKRSFADVVYELEEKESPEERDLFRQSLPVKSGTFVAVFHEDAISAKMRQTYETTYHKYVTVTASPIVPQHRVLKIYFSVLSALLKTRAILLDALYEEESAFSPYTVFGLFYDDCVSVINSTPGLLYDNGVVWVVDFCFGAVYNLCQTSLQQLKMSKETRYEKTNIIC